MANQTVIFYNSWSSISQVKSNLARAWVNYIDFIPFGDSLRIGCMGKETAKEIFIQVFESVARGTCYPPRKKQILRQMYQ